MLPSASNAARGLARDRLWLALLVGIGMGLGAGLGGGLPVPDALLVECDIGALSYPI